MLEFDPFEFLQGWYWSQCDEDWEHQCGIHIDTLDNPGWQIYIDIGETNLAGITLAMQETHRSEHDWIQWRSDGTKFDVACGPFNLREALSKFQMFAVTAAEADVGD